MGIGRSAVPSVWTQIIGVTIITNPAAVANPPLRDGRQGALAMELDHVVLADVASPRPDGKLDLHGVGWDTIFATAVPATHPRMDVVVRFLLSAQEVETDHHVVITLLGTDGAELARMQTDVAAVPPESRAAIPAGRRIGLGILLTLAGVTFPNYGAYSLVITWDGTEVREPVRLFVQPPPAPAAQA